MEDARCRSGAVQSPVGHRPREGSLVGSAIALTALVVMTTAGCRAGSASEVVPEVVPDVVDVGPGADERVCETMTTVLYLGFERIMVVVAGAPMDERLAVEDAYAEARRSVPSDVFDAVTEIERVFDRMGSEYLEVLAGIRRGEPYDRAELYSVVDSRRPELNAILERIGLDESCERVSG